MAVMNILVVRALRLVLAAGIAVLLAYRGFSGSSASPCVCGAGVVSGGQLSVALVPRPAVIAGALEGLP
jgi:hypothetical protein